MIFEVASDMNALLDFKNVYGMRFVGLEDPSSYQYSVYRVPDPEAPYPQDYVIDQDGIVRYWSWEYDPQEVIRTINRLLGNVGVDEPPVPVQGSRMKLAPPVPNPFRPETDLRYELRERTSVRLNVYSVTGSLIRTLVKGVRGPGEHVTRWDGTDDGGQRVASGVYFVELAADGERQTRRAVLLR